MPTRKELIASGVEITPLTREEILLQGVEIEPLNVKERVLRGVVGGGVTPEGTITITRNGTGIDVAQYATADVAVPASAVVSGMKSITANGTGIDVTNYASVNVNVPSNVYGSITVKNNASKPLTFKSFSNDTIPGNYFPLGYTSELVGANGGSKSINALLEYEIQENKYKINCVLDFTGYGTLNLTATAGASTTTVNLVKIKTGRWALEVITTRGTQSVTDTITIAEA